MSATIGEASIGGSNYLEVSIEEAITPRTFRRYSELKMSLVVIVADIVALILSFGAAFILRFFILGSLPVEIFFQFSFIFLGLILLYYGRGLYPGYALHPAEEIRRLTVNTLIGFALVGAVIFVARGVPNLSRFILILACFFALILVPILRSLLRRIAVRLGIWGVPIVLLGKNEDIQVWSEKLKKNQYWGLIPVINMSIDRIGENATPNEDYLDQVSSLVNKFGVSTVMVLVNGSPSTIMNILGAYQNVFRSVILINLELNPMAIWVSPLNFGGMTGYIVKHDMHNSAIMILKRCIDLLFSALCLLVLSPLFLLIAILIRLDSPGPVFYKQWRLGKNGAPFQMLKFRTMYADADEVLKKWLEEDPVIREEWEKYQKLKDDPRITLFGNILRQMSIDEFPQFWNIAIGEMSLIGPRPFFRDQLEEYGDAYRYYVMVRPGLSGLWQVSGRNNTSFEERALWDKYYVSNWSFWLEIYIFFKSIWVVLSRDGAL